MSILRTGLVLGAIVYLMPTDTERQTQLIHATGDAMVWGLTFCEREPASCDQAKLVWAQMVQKAKFGAALAADLAGKWSDQHGANRQSPVQPEGQDDFASPDTPYRQPSAAQRARFVNG